MISWVLAVTLVPVLGSYFYRKGINQTNNNEPSAMQKWFKGTLLSALRLRWITIGALFVITIVAYGSFGMVKQGFFPPSNAPLFFVHYWGPQDRDIRATEEVAKGSRETHIGNGKRNGGDHLHWARCRSFYSNVCA